MAARHDAKGSTARAADEGIRAQFLFGVEQYGELSVWVSTEALP